MKKKEYKARIKELEDRLARYEPPPASVPNFITVEGISFGHFDPADLSAKVFVADPKPTADEALFALDAPSQFIVRKALQRYRARIEEVGEMGWYDNPEVTQQELARVDAILAIFEPTPLP